MSEAESSSEVRETRGANRTPDPLLGRIVGAYRIQERVGEGTGLPSYLAEHVHLDRQVLFKLFHPPRDGGASAAVNGAIQQARRLSALKHEGVLPLVEIAECGDGFMYVVLELSGARPLAALLAEAGPLSWPTVRALGRQVAAAMLAAGTASLASAEPAAAQIFVAKSAGGELRARVDLVTPEALGWVPPRSPDQVRAVGHLLYGMLAGHEPSSASESPLPDLVLSFPDLDIPSDADALIMRAVDAEPSRRWPDLGALHRELGGRDEPSGGEGDGGTSSRSGATLRGVTGAEEDPQDDATFGRRFFTRPSRPALIAGGVGVVVAILVALIIVSGPSESDTVAFRSAAEPKIKLTPPPAPTPIVLPPPPVPEPESPQGPDGAAALQGMAPAAASPENAAAQADPSTEPSALGEAAPAMAAVPPAGPPAAVPVPEAAAVIPVAATTGKALRPAAAPPVAPPAPLAALPQKAPPATPATPTKPAMTAPSPATTGKGTEEPSVRPAEVAAPVAAAAAKESGGEPCTISLGSIPWSDVQVDGKRAGFTPLTDLSVACGTHEILFTSPDRGLERRITLNIRPGEKLKRIVDLGGPKTPAGPPGATAPARPACRVTLGSRPWSEIWIDGHRAGTTPLVDYPIACGTHDVLFLSREANVQHRESLTVQSTLKKVITLVEATD